jgi:hypothetical protein
MPVQLAIQSVKTLNMIRSIIHYVLIYVYINTSKRKCVSYYVNSSVSVDTLCVSITAAVMHDGYH